ncbi:MAG: CCA tRNA nucleotidyltransferase, partial [Rhodospirillaceae bacterium]|nr:CCA tRNA nucleotidyltransferase [Rhodospirillaceae bacterium]
LRFFRFYAEYGKPPMNPEALVACRKLAPRLKELSGERVRGELLRIVMAPNPADTITLMRAENILEQIMPEAGDVGRLRSLAWLIERGINLNDIETDPVRRLGALIKPETSKIDVDNLCERLKFSKREHKHLSMIVCSAKTMPSLTINSSSSEKNIRRACYHLGKELVADKALIEWAGEISTDPHQKPGRSEKWENVLAAITAWQQVRFPLQGRHGIKLGMEPGPELGRALRIIEQWWVDGDFRANEKDCIEQLRQKLQQNDSSLTTI